MAVLYSNNASSALSASITNSATSFSVTAGHGAKFPAITNSDYFYATLVSTGGAIEIVKVTARSTDTFTVVRGQDGTTGTAFTAGDKVELRVTKAMLDDYKTDTRAGTLTGTIETTNARIKFKTADADGGSYALLGLDWGGTAGTYKNFEVYDYVNSRSMLQLAGETRNLTVFGSITAASITSPNGATVVAADSAMPSAASSLLYTLALGPSTNDGHTLGMTWSGGNSAYGAQLWIDTDPTRSMAFRQRSNTGVWNSWNYLVHDGNISSYMASATGHTRASLSAADSVTNLTTGNFRTKMFGSTTSGYNISTGRWDSTPGVLSGLGSYGTMIAWSGSDTHGFLALDYNNANAKIGGGNGDSVNWSAILIHSSNYTSYSPSLTGSGATGTWGISVSGSAASATYGQILDTRAGQYSPDSYEDYRTTFEFTNQIVSGWHTALTMQGWHNGYSAWQIIGPADTSAHENWYLRSGVNTSWNGLRTILHSGNYTNYSPSYSGGTLTGHWYFQSNRNTSSSDAPLQAYSSDGGGAIMSFHRGGYYAVNFGLDSDNVMRIGGWSAGANRWQLDMSGNETIPGRLTAANWTTTGRNYNHEWIELPNHTGFYSPLNSAHFYPNNASYGSWRIAGERNGWGGIEFDRGNQVCLMVNNNECGFHNNSYGWMIQWYQGSLNVSKGSNGGSTAQVLDSSNYTGHIASMQYNTVGSYAFLCATSTISMSPNGLASGGTLYPSGVRAAGTPTTSGTNSYYSGTNTGLHYYSASTLSGTWRCMGAAMQYLTTATNFGTLWIRIS